MVEEYIEFKESHYGAVKITIPKLNVCQINLNESYYLCAFSFLLLE